jgi:dTDP-4-dehydrorhamnose reductase
MKIAVFGATGMLGSEVVAAARERGHEAITPTHQAMPIEVGVGFAAPELPDVIINCAGLISQRGEVPVRAMLMINGAGPHHLAALGIRLVHMSTDCVFSGEIGSGHCYSSSDNPTPKDLYGRSKLAGELDAPHVLVVRGSFIGEQHGFLRWLLDARGVVQAYAQTYWNGSTASHMARALVDLAESERTGIVHVAAERAVSKGWMVEYLADALDLPISSIEVVSEPRINRALCPDIELPPVREVLDEIIAWIKERESAPVDE